MTIKSNQGLLVSTAALRDFIVAVVELEYNNRLPEEVNRAIDNSLREQAKDLCNEIIEYLENKPHPKKT